MNTLAYRDDQERGRHRRSLRAPLRPGRPRTDGSRGTRSAGTVEDEVMKYAFVVTDTPDLQKNNEKSVGRLKRKSRFGASVVIMPSVTIGENAEIGACSQVRKDVPDNEVWFGTPAKYYRAVDVPAVPAAPARKLALAR